MQARICLWVEASGKRFNQYLISPDTSGGPTREITGGADANGLTRVTGPSQSDVARLRRPNVNSGPQRHHIVLCRGRRPLAIGRRPVGHQLVMCMRAAATPSYSGFTIDQIGGIIGASCLRAA